jgi:hypothetical protein
MAERTALSPPDEAAFRAWAAANKIADVDHPDSHYDYRGYFKEHGAKPVRFGVDHFTDRYKQHGHPSFSQESQYSTGPSDGGMWLTDTVQLQQPKMAVSHLEQALLRRGAK